MESQKSLEIEWPSHENIPKEDKVFSFLHQFPPLYFRYPESSGINYDPDVTYLMDIISKTPIHSSMDILPDPTVVYEGGILAEKYGELGFLDQEIATMNSLSFPNQETYMNTLEFPDQELSMMNALSFPTQETYMNTLEFPNQELPMMNALSFPTQEMTSLGFPNQEMYMNTLEFPNQELSMMNALSFPTQEMMSLGFPNQGQPVIMAMENVKEKEETKMVRSYGCEQSQKELDHKDGNGNGDGGCEFNHPLRLTLSMEMISQYFYMPIADAAKELNIGITLLKRRCRELGIKRWPRRKLKSLQTLITSAQELGQSSGNGVEEELQEAIMRFENERKRMEEIPDLQLEDNTIRLRQACYKAIYKKRKTIGTR